MISHVDEMTNEKPNLASPPCLTKDNKLLDYKSEIQQGCFAGHFALDVDKAFRKFLSDMPKGRWDVEFSDEHYEGKKWSLHLLHFYEFKTFADVFTLFVEKWDRRTAHHLNWELGRPTLIIYKGAQIQGPRQDMASLPILRVGYKILLDKK